MLSTVNLFIYDKIVFCCFSKCNNFAENLNFLGKILVTSDF